MDIVGVAAVVLAGADASLAAYPAPGDTRIARPAYTRCEPSSERWLRPVGCRRWSLVWVSESAKSNRTSTGKNTRT